MILNQYLCILHNIAYILTCIFTDSKVIINASSVELTILLVVFILAF